MFREVMLFGVGLTLFLYGMIRLKAEIQLLLTPRMRRLIQYAAATRASGFTTGIVSTVLFQSSSTTTALIVGLVSAGLITFYDSLAIILGADIGTTLTVQFVVWKVTDLSPILVITGGLVWIVDRPKWRALGNFLFYFGVMLFGLSIIGQSASLFKQSALSVGLFTNASKPWLGLAVGILFTGIVHSSAIPISMLAMLAQQDMISLNAALPIVFGANIGTTVTAITVAAFGSLNAKRTAFAHLIFKCCGALVCLLSLPLVIRLLQGVSTSVPQQVALGHFLFNLVVAFTFLFLLKIFARLIERLVPGKDDSLQVWPQFLTEECLRETSEALECTRKELGRQLHLAESMYDKAKVLMSEYRDQIRRDIEYVEMVVDNLRHEIAEYLWQLSNRDLSPVLTHRLFAYTAMVDDIERIADHAVVISRIAKKRHVLKAQFSPQGWSELTEISELVQQNLGSARMLVSGFDGNSVENIFRNEEQVDRKVKEARGRHLDRFHHRVCKADSGPLFLELLLNLERVSDHCENIAEYSVELNDIAREGDDG
jgi:phosphate:Na+ symporter